MKSIARAIDRCRSCGGHRIDEMLDLGNLAISDFVADPTAPVDRSPLTLVRCDDCTLVQLSHSVHGDRLFKPGRYGYQSGMNETMIAALRAVAEDAIRQVRLKPGDAVLDIGCNDGTLLRFFPECYGRYGIDPVADQFPHLRGVCSAVAADYFPPRSPYPDDAFKIITSIAQFYNVDDVNEYVATIKRILHPEGVWIVQMMDLHSMVSASGFDNICHEHLTYWSVRAFERLLTRHSLRLDRVRYEPINGGSVRVTVCHGDAPSCSSPIPGEVPVKTSYEVSRTALYWFVRGVEYLREKTTRQLQRLKADGASIYGYAASTKANTVLQYYDLGPDLITAFADRNPQKWGMYTVGTNIPIISEAEMRAAKPDYLYLGAWQFLDAFRGRERALLEAGTRFIVPLPNLRIVGLDDNADLLTA